MRYRDHRFATDREIRVAHDGRIDRVRLANVSATGARLRDLPPLEAGQPVILCHLQLKIRAKVVWSNARQTGVTFLEPLSAEQLQSLAGTVGKAPSALGLRSHGFRELR